MTCDDVRDNLSAYLDGELARPEAAAVESHLAGCESCRAELASLRSLTETLHALPRRPAPAEVEREVVGQLERDALLAPRELPKKRRFVLPIFGGAALAAAALVAVAVHVHLASQEPTESKPALTLSEDGWAGDRASARDGEANRYIAGAPGSGEALKKQDGEHSAVAEAPAVEPDMKLAGARREVAAPAFETEDKDVVTIIEPPLEPIEPPQVLELKLAAGDAAVERDRIVRLAAALDIREVHAAKLALGAEIGGGAIPKDEKTRGSEEGRLRKTDEGAPAPAAPDGGRVREALNRVVQNARTDDEYETAIGRLLGILEQSEARAAAAPVIVLAVPEDKLGPFVAQLAAGQGDREGVQVMSLRRSNRDALAYGMAKGGATAAPENADALDEFMRELDKAAAEDAERERMAKEEVGRAGEGGPAGGKTRAGGESADARKSEAPAAPAVTSEIDRAKKNITAPVPSAVTRTLREMEKNAPAAPRVVYLQILLTPPASAGAK